MLVACNRTDKFKLISNKSYGCSKQPLWDSNFKYCFSSRVHVCCVCIDFDFGAFGWRVAFVFTCCFEISQMTTYSKKFITYMGQIYIDFILGMAEGREHCKTYQINCILFKPMKIFIFLSGQNFCSQTCQNLQTFTCICERGCACMRTCVRKSMSDFVCA